MKKLALTFDDGPNDPHTLDLLEVLAKHDVRATFFMLGKFVKERPDIAQAVANAKHWIGNHTQSHPHLPQVSLGQVVKEIDECTVALSDCVGSHSSFFRPPFMESSPEIEGIVTTLGLTSIGYRAAGGDGGERHGPDFIVEKVARELNGESGIILLHDGFHEHMGGPRGDTVIAVDRLIVRCKSEGFEFVSPLEI